MCLIQFLYAEARGGKKFLECKDCPIKCPNYEPKDEPTISKKEQVDDEPQSNADQRIQGVESVEPMQTERSV